MHLSVSRLLTYVSPPWLDDNGTPTASLLLNLSHALPGLLVGVVCGTYCNLVLDPTQTIQLNAPFTAKTKRRLWERKTGIERERDKPIPCYILEDATLKYLAEINHFKSILSINFKYLTICKNPSLQCAFLHVRSIKQPEGTTIIFSISIQLWVLTVRLTAASNPILSWLSGSLWFASTLMRIWQKMRWCWRCRWKLSSVIWVLDWNSRLIRIQSEQRCGWTPPDPLVKNIFCIMRS